MTRWVAILATLLATLAFGACGDSPEDEAHDDGEQVGQAVRAVFDADSVESAEAAIEDVRTAVDDVGEDARKRVQDQVETQRGTLTDAVNAAKAVGSSGAASGNPEDALAALKGAVQQLRAQAASFRSGNNSVANEFWRGFEEGYDGD